jgi:hypothetical protein
MHLGSRPAARFCSRRSSLKSIHWIDLPGFAGRTSPLAARNARLAGNDNESF